MFRPARFHNGCRNSCLSRRRNGCCNRCCNRCRGQSSLEYLICLVLMLGSLSLLFDDPWASVVSALHGRYQQFSAQLGQP
jgi:hypothetical protein